jgi:hypothetical protein
MLAPAETVITGVRLVRSVTRGTFTATVVPPIRTAVPVISSKLKPVIALAELHPP